MNSVLPKNRLFVVPVRRTNNAGNAVRMPIGIETAICVEQAFERAYMRWQQYTHDAVLLDPVPWEEVSPDVRLDALRADRGEYDYRG